MNPDELEVNWIRSCQAGQRSAFEPLVHRYRVKAYYAALALVRNPDDALDIAQEAFFKAFSAIGRFDVARPFYPWLKTIVRNTARSWLTARKPDVGDDAARQVAWTITPEMLASRDEEIERLRDAMNQLGDNDRQILYLKHFESLKYRQIAEVLDVPIGTVMSRLYTARTRLRALLEERP